MASFNMSKEYTMVLMIVIFMGYLYLTNQLNNTLLFIFGSLIAVLLLIGSNNLKKIDIRQAKMLAKEYMEESQKDGDIPRGLIKLYPEQELKNFIVVGSDASSSELVSYKFDFIFSVSSRSESYYIVKIGVYGNVLGISEISRKQSIQKVEPEIRRIEASVKTDDEFREQAKEKGHIERSEKKDYGNNIVER